MMRPLALLAVMLLCGAARADELPALRRGINVLGYDGIWNGEVDNPFRMNDFDRIRAAGFDHVRINFFGLRHMDATGKLGRTALAALDKAIDGAIARGLVVVLDQHQNEECVTTPLLCKDKLVAFWKQVSTRYAGTRPALLYEILNEPGGVMTHEQWNDALADALAEIRAHDRERPVVVAALNVGGPVAVTQLRLPPDDRRLIVTVHYYEPMRFTHQSAPWSPDYAKFRNVAWGAADSRAAVEADFAPAAAWARENGRPMWLGEFGVYDKAPPLSRAAWTRHVARAAEKSGWGWAFWEFDHEFAAIDIATGAWRQDLLDALMDKPPANP